MPDTIDYIQEEEALFGDSLLHEAHQAASLIPVGAPGECEECGEHSLRLVNKTCARCREDSERGL